MTPPTSKPGQLAQSALDALGFGALFLLAVVTPTFLWPVAWFPSFNLESAEQPAAKALFLQAMASVAVGAAALALLTPLYRRWTPPLLLPAGLLLLFAGWMGASIAVNPGSLYLLWLTMPQFAAIAAALVAPCFLRDERRVRWLLLGIAGASVVVALVGVASWAGWRGFNHFVYGVDPRDVLDDPTKFNLRRVIQGGARSAAAASTLSNPEWAGTYQGVMVVLTATLLLDWCGRFRRPWLARGIFGGMLALQVLHMAATSSRMAVLTVVTGAALRLAIALEVRRLHLAVGFSAVLATALAVSLPAALGVAVVAGLVLLGDAARRGVLWRVLASAGRFQLATAVALPAVLAVLLLAFSVPGPWNPRGMRVLQRFGSALSYNDQSLRERLMMYMLASEMTWQNPVFGVGPGRYGNQFSLILGELAERDETGTVAVVREKVGETVGVESHNDYMQIAAETGLPGLLLFLALITTLLGALNRIARDSPDAARRLTARTVLLLLVAWLTIMLTSFPLQTPDRMAVFWMTVGCALALIAHGEPSGDAPGAPA